PSCSRSGRPADPDPRSAASGTRASACHGETGHPADRPDESLVGVKQVFEPPALLKDMKTKHVEFGHGLRRRLAAVGALRPLRRAPAQICVRPVTVPLSPRAG